MTIPTRVSLHGFIASTPHLHVTRNGTARFHARVGVEHYRKEADGSLTKLDSTFHHLVAYAKTAELAYARFAAGDSFVASGHIHRYEVERNRRAEAREEFVARRIGHDLARTTYEVTRARSRHPDPPRADRATATTPAQAIGL